MGDLTTPTAPLYISGRANARTNPTYLCAFIQLLLCGQWQVDARATDQQAGGGGLRDAAAGAGDGNIVPQAGQERRADDLPCHREYSWR